MCHFGFPGNSKFVSKPFDQAISNQIVEFVLRPVSGPVRTCSHLCSFVDEGFAFRAEDFDQAASAGNACMCACVGGPLRTLHFPRLSPTSLDYQICLPVGVFTPYT